MNLTLVTGTTDGFIFQIINSLIETWGVRLTCFDCNFCVEIKLGFEACTMEIKSLSQTAVPDSLEMYCLLRTYLSRINAKLPRFQLNKLTMLSRIVYDFRACSLLT